MSRRLALIIGNSQYDDPGLARLAAPDVDVRELGEALRSPDLGRFDEVEQLVDETSPAVRRAIARLFHLKRRDDLLLLYFSGHGIRDDQGQLYLATRDTERNLLAATSVEASFVTSQMDRSASRRQVLILDCCHSGAFGAKNALGASIGTAAAFEGIGFGRVVLTATDATQYAWEGDQVVGAAEPSLFTNFLVLGIQSGAADLNGDGEVTIDELYEYTYEEVVNSTSKQVPGKWAFKQQGEIVIARNPLGSPASPLPQALIDKIDSHVEGLQLQAIRDLAVILRGRHRARSVAARAALEKLATSDTPRVAEAARDMLAMYPAPRHSVAGPEFETVAEVGPHKVPAASGWHDARLRRGLRLSAFVLVALVLALSGAFGVWKWSGGRRGGGVPPVSEPPRITEPAAPTSGTGAAPVARGDATAAETRPDDAEGRAAPRVEATDASRTTTSQTARGPAPPAASNKPRTPPPGKNSADRRRSSPESRPNDSPVTPPPDAPVVAPKELEPAPPAAERKPRDVDLTALDRQAILKVLERFREAYNRKDLEAIKQIYPTVPRNPFGRGLQDCAAFDLRFVDPVVHFLTANTAQVNTSTIYRCIPKSRSAPKPTPPLQDRFEFERTADGWVIKDQLVQIRQ